MCGICGVLSHGTGHLVNEQVVKAMAATLRHRGPDESGLYLRNPEAEGPRLAMAHRRLSIVDLDTGQQPLYNENGSLCLIANGEIYNYPQLRPELENQGHRFSTRSDCESILHLYENYGLDFADHLAGMFAFALWDENLQRLILVRDRMGVKPLHYYYHQGLLVFASELKGILVHPQVRRSINIPALYEYLTFEYVPAPNTIIEHTYKIEPGEMVVLEKGTIRSKIYWDLKLTEGDSHFSQQEQCIERTEELFDQAVKRRLMSDVEVGVFLSGGLDSSLVLAKAQRYYGRPMQAFTIGFEDKSFDESIYAEQVAKLMGSNLHVEMLNELQLLNVIEKLNDILDEPFADQSVVPTYLLSQLAASKVKVALSGDGGDDILAGYVTYPAFKLIKLYQVLPSGLRAAINKMVQKLPVKHNYISLDFKLKQFMRGAGHSSEIMFFQWMGSLNDKEKADLFLPYRLKELDGHNTWDCLYRHINNSHLSHDLERILYLMMKLYLQDGILVKVDRASMAASLEVRSPFLDHQLVEYINYLPSNLKLRRLTTKYILKKMGERVLPKEIVYRKKKGFGIPVGQWFRGKLKPLLTDYLSPDRIGREGYFDPKVVNKLVEDHLKGNVDNRKPLWTILMFEMWFERWMSSSVTPPKF